MRRHASLLLPLALLAIVASAVLAVACHRTGGRFIYALDDAYITMAMAKNLALHGVWGVTPFGFSSSASSSLWLAIVASTYAGLGVNELSPLVLNLGMAAALIVASHRSLRRSGCGAAATAGLLVALVLLFPVVPVAATGLEHLLHATLSVLFLDRASTLLAAPAPGAAAPPARTPRFWPLVGLAALLVACRYEGLFLVAGVGLLLLIRRRVVPAALLGAAAALPVLAYGLFARSHGWPFLPTSVLLKGQLPAPGWRGLAGLLGLNALREVARAPHLLALMLAGAVVLFLGFIRTGRARERPAILLAITLGASLLHVDLARTGWFFRYEAYLVAMWIVSLGAAWPEIAVGVRRSFQAGPVHRIAAAVIAVAVIFPVAARGAVAHVQTPIASSEIHDQQYRMGRFLHAHFENRRVAANDIGAINFLATLDNLDVVGLGSLEVAEARLRRRYDRDAVAAIARARRMEIAIVYDSWFEMIGGVPREWIKVGEWTIRSTVVVAGATVSFYAVDPSQADVLRGRLRAFAGGPPG